MSDRLDGWKEIAGYLHRSTRTAQRWERQLHLPVHRLKTAAGEVVYALPAELDEWFRQSEAVNEPADLDLNGNDAEPDTADAPEPDPAPTGSRRPWAIAAAVGVSAIALAAYGVARQTSNSRTGAQADASNEPPPSITLPFAPSLDPGPWPIQNHDSRRSNQGSARGPSHPLAPRLLYDSPDPLFYAAPNDAYGEPLAVTSDGKMIVGTCGRLLAIDSSGRRLWDAALSERGSPVGVSGVAVAGGGQIVVATHTCEDSLDARKVKLMAFSGAGSLKWTQTRAGMYLGPAIGPDQTVYQMDEFNDIHAYANGMMTWTVDLPGYAQGAIAVDSHGNLYAGTDGGTYGQPSLWSLDRAGRIRWSLGRDTYTTPVVSVTDDVYSVDRKGTLHSFDADGRERWKLDTSTGTVSFEPLAIAASGTVYVRVPGGVTAVAPDGRIRWQHEIAGPAHAGPILDADENVYVAGADQIVSLTSGGAVRWTASIRAPGRVVMGPGGTLLVIAEFRRIYAIGDAQAGTTTR